MFLRIDGTTWISASGFDPHYFTNEKAEYGRLNKALEAARFAINDFTIIEAVSGDEIEDITDLVREWFCEFESYKDWHEGCAPEFMTREQFEHWQDWHGYDDYDDRDDCAADYFYDMAGDR